LNDILWGYSFKLCIKKVVFLVRPTQLKDNVTTNNWKIIYFSVRYKQKDDRNHLKELQWLAFKLSFHSNFEQTSNINLLDHTQCIWYRSDWFKSPFLHYLIAFKNSSNNCHLNLLHNIHIPLYIFIVGLFSKVSLF